ncbi:MAG: NADH:ubiquinone oxidoreductase, na translocating, f subunit [Piscirickettsiaceae bacterium]|nr:MAG: NADH:ubiquinone oxidoreductase, na translocating, f subunit [Piscirickettsiaceae bacterium]PCI69574.1 MAG: NADH:ubiquinone oxidoreductase, na translocating, f subunit [Piscirickettsiaceae bacterium]
MNVTHTGQVTYSEPVSKGIILLKIKLTKPRLVDFKAGQYLAVLLPNSDKVAYYSIASSPKKPGEVELLVKEDKFGAGAVYLYSLKDGDEIQLHMPMGSAFLREDSDCNLVFVAGASGASYIRSMIHYLDEINHLARREVHYFLGCREESELLESDFMHKLAEKYSGFHYHPAVSHQEDWDGHTGLITEVVDRIMPADMAEWQAYSAGSPAMVKAVADELIANKNLMPSKFFSDLYTPEI